MQNKGLIYEIIAKPPVCLDSARQTASNRTLSRRVLTASFAIISYEMEYPAMAICTYDDSEHRSQVVALWRLVFNYSDARNAPDLTIDSKLAVNDNLFFVAVEENQVVGTIMAGYDGHRGWIYSLAVAPANRHKNTGTALLTHAENALKKLGCIKVNLQVLPSNEAVTEFYIKNGYRVEPRISMGKELRKF